MLDCKVVEELLVVNRGLRCLVLSGAALPIDGGFVAAPFNNAMAPGYDRSKRTGRRTLMTAAPFSGDGFFFFRFFFFS